VPLPRATTYGDSRRVIAHHSATATGITPPGSIDGSSSERSALVHPFTLRSVLLGLGGAYVYLLDNKNIEFPVQEIAQASV
jgi:hypothetical protein